MKKIILFSLIGILLILSAGVFYLNNVVLPIKVKGWIVNGIAEQTQKKVTLDSVSVNILRGLTLKNLTIYDDSKSIVSIKEASCGIIIFPIFQKRLIVPFVNIRSPALFLERLSDGTFNLEKLIAPKSQKSGPAGKPGFDIAIYRLNITNANLYFQDDTLPQPFKKEIRKLNIAINLGLPSDIKFRLTGQLHPQPGAAFKGSGNYDISSQELSAKFNIKDFSPKEVEPYYRNSGISIPSGKLGAGLDILYKNGKITYAGKLNIAGCRLEGLSFAKLIDNISGDLVFDSTGLSSEGLSAVFANIPFKAKVKLSDYANPKFVINIPQIDLKNLPAILNYEFGFISPGSASSGSASFTLQARRLPGLDKWEVLGYADISDAFIKFPKLPWPLEKLSGRINFYPDLMEWESLNFNMNSLPFTASGSWSEFKAPHIRLKLASQDFKLNTDFIIQEKLIIFNEFNGGFKGSGFYATGRLNTQDGKNALADISGKIDADLEDLRDIFKEGREKFEKAALKGRINADFSFNGRPDDFKNSTLQVKVVSPMLSAYGLKTENLTFNYNQTEGAGSFSSINMPFYGGNIQGTLFLDYSSPKLPYRMDFNLDGVKIEQLKEDSRFKKEDIAGTIRSKVKLSGLFADPSALVGSGDIAITGGRLWELNLFKGMGKLLFVRDFTSIIFKDGSCAFTVGDKSVSTDNLVLKSDIADLDGKVKIGFDSSVNALLNVHILTDSVPLTGTFRDVATAILGQAGRFGVIKITGTLKDPKHSFEPAVVDILKGLTNVLMGNTNR